MRSAKWIQSPCKDCPDRHLKCHATCERFWSTEKNIKRSATEFLRRTQLKGQSEGSTIQVQASTKKPLHHLNMGG